MQRPGPPYSPEFRAEAVRRLRSGGITVAELSRELGVSEQTLRRWRRQAGGDRATVSGPATDAQLPNHRGKDTFMRMLARLTAEVIETGVAVVTLPAKWAANGLRWYADRKDEPPGGASEGRHGAGRS